MHQPGLSEHWYLGRNPAYACIQHVITSMTAPSLPADLLQQTARSLDFLDLLRRRQVCRDWYDSIPDNEPVLRERLFLRSRTLRSDFPYLSTYIGQRLYTKRSQRFVENSIHAKRRDHLSSRKGAVASYSYKHKTAYGCHHWRGAREPSSATFARIKRASRSVGSLLGRYAFQVLQTRRQRMRSNSGRLWNIICNSSGGARASSWSSRNARPCDW